MRTAVYAGGLNMNVSYVRTPKSSANGYAGYDIYIDGIWVGWTAGGMADARKFVKNIETNRAHAVGKTHPAHIVQEDDGNFPCPGIPKQ